jgi:serine/threonine protein kinase
MAGVPERIGRYTVARELGSGGMGEVYLAYTPGDAPVAVKLIRSDKIDPLTRARFEKEALIASTVVTRGRSVCRPTVAGPGVRSGAYLTSLRGSRQVRMRPDLVWYEESGAPMAVADAKCKAGRLDGYPDADIYQMLAY